MDDQRNWKFPDGERLDWLYKVSIRVRGTMYRADPGVRPAVGDVVIDRKDGAHGEVDDIFGEVAAVRDGFFVQTGIPLTRLVRLRPAVTSSAAVGT
jgi:hypothetical protein